ncbi:MAG: biliverdin-producing heme oxygenase [Phycisphaerales bacterium]|nr:biliverdin-producing heme oxygenase [Phycisphaerales bacterium]
MPGIMQRLRDETAALHQHAETRPLEQAMVRGEIQLDTYVENLAQRYLVHRRLESEIRALCASDARLAGLVLDEQWQLPNLEADLAHFGAPMSGIEPTRGALRLIEHIEATAHGESLGLLGVFYVFEGSKNGAHFLAPRVRAALRLPGSDGSRYLDPHGARQRELWTQFKSRMDAVDFSPAECDAMLRGAKAAFMFVAEIDDDVYSHTVQPVSTRT